VDGKICEQGNHQQLMNQNDGIYYALVNAQTLVQQKKQRKSQIFDQQNVIEEQDGGDTNITVNDGEDLPEYEP